MRTSFLVEVLGNRSALTFAIAINEALPTVAHRDARSTASIGAPLEALRLLWMFRSR